MQSAGSQIIEEFWGVALTPSNKESKWIDQTEESDALYTDRTLELRQACLGASAKEGERNVVELTTDNEDGESVTHTILSMKVGLNEQSTLFLTLRPPVTLKLVKGNGPIHIIGQMNETLDMDSLMSTDEESEEESDTEIGNKPTESKKRPATSMASNSAKIAKLSANVKKNGLANGSDGSEEDDEDDDEDEFESEEDESEEEIALPPPKSKKVANGNSAKKQKNVMFKTPQPPKPNGKPQKKNVSAPTTPKSGKKSGGKDTPKGPNISEIKERLTKMSVPKKLEKFNNFISNSFKVQDDSVKKQLWEYVQKKRPQE